MKLAAPRSAVDAPPAVAWEDVPCPLCGAEAADTILESADPTPAAGPGRVFAVARCRRCGLTYTNPRPSAAAIGRFYPADYKPHRRPHASRPDRTPSWWATATGRAVPERKGRLPWTGPPGRLLDFGCGSGSYLERMHARGWTVVGLDTSPQAVDFVRMSLKLDARLGTLPDAALEPASFDVVTMWHSLEHVHDPVAAVRAAFDLLVPGGKLIVAVPNIASAAFRWFGPAWFGLDLPRHLTHFDPVSLRRVLISGGFRVQEVRGVRHADWLRTSAARAGGWGTALSWKPAARLFANIVHLAGGDDCILATADRP